MTKAQKLRIRLAALALGAGVLFIPITVTSGTGSDPGIATNEACADGSCCLEYGSLCELEDEPLLNYYADKVCGQAY